MSKLLSPSKHEEFELNSALHIKSWKEREAENRKKRPQQKFCKVAKISQHAKFCRLRIFATYEFSQVAKFASYEHCSPAF